MKRMVLTTGLAACAGMLSSLPVMAQEVTATTVSASNTTATAAEALPASAVQDDKNPLMLWQRDDGSHLKATVKMEAAYFNQGNSWFGKDKENLGGSSDYWLEGAVHPGIEGSLFLDQSEFYGRLSMVYGITAEGRDAAGSNAGGDRENQARIEDGYIGWRSGDLFSIGKDFIDLSIGRRQYVAGNGFLFYSQSSNGKNRGAYWMGERHAADYAGILTFNVDKFKSDLIYLKADDKPNTETKAAGITLDYADEEWGSLGGGFYNISSDLDTRDNMDIYDIRGSLSPFKAMNGPDFLQPLTFEGEYAHERNGDKMNADGWYAQCSYDFENTAWKPGFTYRFASFEGDDADTGKSEDFDPLFYGFNDWGYWYQGEILGEYALSNSNLDSHSFMLKASPTDSLTLRMIYYIFELNSARGYGVESDDFANELDLIADWNVNDHLSLSFVLAYADPDDGAEEAYGGDDNWVYGMLYGSVTF